MPDQQPVSDRRKRHLFTAVLCAVCLLINFLGVRVALALNLPLFLDIIGTTLAAALGGYIPALSLAFSRT